LPKATVAFMSVRLSAWKKTRLPFDGFS
jgi:hypothetical protein